MSAWTIDVTYNQPAGSDAYGWDWKAHAFYDGKDHTLSSLTQWWDRWAAVNDAMDTIEQYKVTQTEQETEEGYRYKYV